MKLRTQTMIRISYRAAFFFIVLAFGVAVPAALAQQLSNKPLIDITGYVIDATVVPATHQLHATAKVSFTALDAVPVAPTRCSSCKRLAPAPRPT